jgi:AcrR family transcriptional regulator
VQALEEGNFLADRALRDPLSRERVLAAAVALADAGGIEAVTMRGIADELGCEAMSLYYYVKGKDELLAGLVEVILDEIISATEADDAAASDEEWNQTVRRRCLTARVVMLRHPWARSVIAVHDTIPANSFVIYEKLVGTLVDAGFSYDLAHRAIHALGSMVLGFAQELFDPGPGSEDEVSAEAMEQMAAAMPHLTAMAEMAFHESGGGLSTCDTQAEFEFTLSLILDGLGRAR